MSSVYQSRPLKRLAAHHFLRRLCGADTLPISLMKLDDCGSPLASAEAVMTKWRGLYDALSPDRKVMLFNSQVDGPPNPPIFKT